MGPKVDHCYISAKLSPVDSTNSALLGKGPRASQVKFKATVTEQTIEEDQPTSMSNVRHDAKLNDETAEEENEPESSFSGNILIFPLITNSNEIFFFMHFLSCEMYAKVSVNAIYVADKVKRGMEFAWELFLSGIDSFILFLNKHNKTFRNIVMQLSVEKENLNQRHCISARVSVFIQRSCQYFAFKGYTNTTETYRSASNT